jgi:polyphosphate kinase 2
MRKIGERGRAAVEKISKEEYRKSLHALQIELVKLQNHLIKCNDKILVIVEGRDAAGKDGVIKRIVQHLSPRETRVVALGKPLGRELSTWYFQRFVPHLPAAQEFVLFNRSWYNRAGVERVMKFCTEEEYEEFMQSVLPFERMLVDSGIKLFKYYLDISRKEQNKRLENRRKDPLKQWKSSPIDSAALKHWKDYSRARDEMFERTHNPLTPWMVVRANEKRAARLNLIKDLLTRLHFDDKHMTKVPPNRSIVFPYDRKYLRNGLIEP